MTSAISYKNTQTARMGRFFCSSASWVCDHKGAIESPSSIIER